VTNQLRVLCDASPLCDDRRTAGIGRYVDRICAALRDIGSVDLRVALPRRAPLRNAMTVRWLHAQPRLAVSALLSRPALVHAMASEPALGVPLHRQVVTVHDVVPWEPGWAAPSSVTGRYLAWQRDRFRRCAAVIAVSDRVAAEAAERLRLDPARVHVVAEGVDAVFGAEAAADDGARRAAIGVDAPGYLLWVGSLVAPDPRKGLDLLLDTVAGLGDARLVMAGRTGRAADAVRDQARRLGLRLHLTGWVDDPTLAALYRGAAAVVVASRHEGFGLTLLEAMACGAPVVATRAGNLPDLAADAALLVPPGDGPALAAALGRIAGDAGLRSRLGAAGQARARGFTWERAAERTAAVYAGTL
jgi:glycosyltransferase involved in cell wall biosynthesis